MLLIALTLALASPPEAAVTYAFEVHALDLGRLDDTLEGYGFAPVGRAPLLTNGVRGELVFDNGIGLGLGMRTAVSVRGRDRAVPTVLQATWTTAHVGRSLVGPLRFGGDIGLAAVSQSVGSERQGGALVYLGPFVQPRITVRLVDGPGVVEIAGGWAFSFPVGAAHSNALWEEPFTRRMLQGPTVAVHSGFGMRRNP